MKKPIAVLLAKQKMALKAAAPKSRDRIRRRVKVLEVARLLARKSA